jgi:hypothetical protein
MMRVKVKITAHERESAYCLWKRGKVEANQTAESRAELQKRLLQLINNLQIGIAILHRA